MRNVQYEYSLGKWKAKSQRDSIYPTEIATVKKTNKDMGKWKPLCIADRIVKRYNHLGRQFGSFLKC